MTGVLVGAALIIVAALVALATSRNRFVRQQQLVIESWRQVEVELQRRHDLECTLAALAADDAAPADAKRTELQRLLIDTEDRVAAARRFYNANVRALRTRALTFPSSVVAGATAVPAPDYFAADAEALDIAPLASAEPPETDTNPDI